MIQLLLILMGLISNPSSTNASNSGNDNPPVIVQPAPPTPSPGDTGGEEIHTPKK